MNPRIILTTALALIALASPALYAEPRAAGEAGCRADAGRLS